VSGERDLAGGNAALQKLTQILYELPVQTGQIARLLKNPGRTAVDRASSGKSKLCRMKP